MSTTYTVFLVDDDPGIRDAVTTFLAQANFQVVSFADGNSFLGMANSVKPDCVLLDVHMPGRSGIEILKELNNQRFDAPVLIFSGQGDIPIAVEAIKNGALDFIEKPFNPDLLVDRILAAIEARQARYASTDALAAKAGFPGSDLLTQREREVLMKIASGASNKEVGKSLGISPRTVEVHRARIMEKLSAKNAADLVRIVMTASS